ncbi:MAG TPA: cation diffusion facilitator family transporter [Acidimicrobiales bacterium]
MAGHPHRHHQEPSAEADRVRLAVALGLIVAFMVVEVVVAALSGSLVLLADAGHMLADAGAIGAALWAGHLAARPASGPWTFGFKRAEILSAAGNGISLLVVAAIVTFVSVRRLINPPVVDGLPVVIVAGVGIAVNVLAAWILARANRSGLNVAGAFQHILTDLYGFVATVVAGIVIIAAGYRRADAVASLVVVVLMLRAAWGLLKASIRVLLEAAPEAVDLADVRAHLLEPAHVRDVHDLHVWTVTSDLPALSAHVVVDDSCFLDGHAPQVLDELQNCLAGHFDLEHSTFQLEPASHAAHETGTHS